MALTDVKCRGTKPGKVRQKLSDGGGLQLWVQPNGSRLWQLIYQFEGKQAQMALGPYGRYNPVLFYLALSGPAILCAPHR
jgi:hypothetical protein